MPKLNVQQNNQNVIQAFKNALAIGNLKGIIASDGNHNFSTAGSNRNLLDNPWFTAGNVVNQKEFSSMDSVGGYVRTVDRWLVNSSGATLSSDGITIEPTGNDYGLLQRMERSRLIANETYTLSVVINGTLYTRTFVWNSNKYFTNFYGTVRAYIGSPNDNPFAIWIVGRPGDSFTISKIKLELGSVSTLANDVPPNYDEELVKCKRYFRRITNIGRGRLFIGVGFSGGVEVPNIFGVGNEMRKTTSLTVTYSGSFVVNAGTDIAVTGISRNENNSNFGLSFAASGITPYTLYSILGSAGAYIDISADL